MYIFLHIYLYFSMQNQQSQDVVKKQIQGSVPNSVGVTECIQT